MLTIPRVSINTNRLVLRPTERSDADRAFEILSDWVVARMLSLASYPPDKEEIQSWFADHEREWIDGEAYRFAVELDGEFIGVVDVDEIDKDEGEFGYWFDKAFWGQGLASEAAMAIVRFAFETIELTKLRANFEVDNAGSRHVLEKLGFRTLDTVRRRSRPRGETTTVCRTILAALP